MSYVIVRVASATGRSVERVIRDSYALTLYTFLQLEEERRLTRLLEEGDRLSLGGLISVAFNEPKKLSQIHDRYRSKLRGRLSREDAFAQAADLLRREAMALERLAGKTKPKKRR